MSESAPLIGTKEQPIGPKTSDYVKVIVWPFLLALCFIGLFVFVMVVPPTKTINFYSVAALATMLLPVIPVLSALVFAKTSVCDSFFFTVRGAAVLCGAKHTALPPCTRHAFFAVSDLFLSFFFTHLRTQQSKSAGNAHFWILVAVCTLVACLTLTNDRLLEGSDVSEFCQEHSYTWCGAGVDLLTDVTLGAILVTVVLGVLGAAATSSLLKKLDIPPLPINA